MRRRSDRAVSRPRNSLLTNGAAVLMMSKQNAVDALWGDGFVEDSAQSCAMVTRWDQLHPDEYVRFFPGLAADEAGRPALAAWVERSALARAWRLRRHGDRARALASASTLSDESFDRSARIACAQVFASDAAWRRWIGWPFHGSSAARAEMEQEDLLALVRLRRELEQDGVEGLDAGSSANFAFLIGIHPDNLRTSTLVSHQTIATAGWLGIVARGRRALMPMDVASVITDAVQVGTDGRVVIRDPVLARMIGSRQHAVSLRRNALKRQANAEVIHRRPSLEHSVAAGRVHGSANDKGIGFLARS